MKNLLELVPETEVLSLIENYVSKLRGRHNKTSQETTTDMVVRFYKLFLDEQFFLTYTDEISVKKFIMTRVKKQLILEKVGESREYTNVFLNDENKLIEFISANVKKLQPRYHPKCTTDLYDIEMNIYTHWKEKKFLEKFDGSITSPHYFVQMGVRNFLIDMERKASHIKVVSGDLEIGEKKEDKLFDLVEDKSADFLDNLLLEELLEKLSKEKSWGNEYETPLFGKVKLSHYVVLKHVLCGYTDLEISKIFNISQSRVCGLRNESIKKMKTYVQE